MKSKILGIIGFLGVFLLTISVNALEQDTISILQCAIMSASGLLIIFLSCHFAGIMSYQHYKTDRYDKKDGIKTPKKQNKQVS